MSITPPLERLENLIFRQLFDTTSSTYTYLLADASSRQALLIDPVFEQLERDLKLLSDLDLKLTWILETHVHADHITSSSALRQRTGAKAALAAHSRVSCADRLLHEGDVLKLGEKTVLEVLETPGHTNGCLTYRSADAVFTGDSLMIRFCGRTDFQEGSAEMLYQSISQKLFTLPDTTRVYPAHDYKGMTSSTIGEEKKFNLRIGGKSREEFAAIMNGLKLPNPQKIDQAVPANLRCGELAPAQN